MCRCLVGGMYYYRSIVASQCHWCQRRHTVRYRSLSVSLCYGTLSLSRQYFSPPLSLCLTLLFLSVSLCLSALLSLSLCLSLVFLCASPSLFVSLSRDTVQYYRMCFGVFCFCGRPKPRHTYHAVRTGSVLHDDELDKSFKSVSEG